ncbi:MAG: hypothetical protein LBR87_03165, partial [Synergistaceae bacterium]|nr:hypothetical protein [Synergistaceae bacterium]
MVKCEMGRMTPDDLDEALKLHARVTRGLSMEIFVQTPEDDMRRLLGDDGVSLGVWFENRLVCMRALMTDGGWVNETLGHMGIEPDAARRTAYMDHCIVDREFRGNNVQFLTYYSMEHYIAERYDTMYTTVSPKNSFSLQNILSSNYVVVGIKDLYGGYLRLIMRKKLSMGMPIWAHGHHVVPLADIKRQRELVADG